MATPPTRIVDAHVHLWDPARTDWYPYLSHPPQQGGGDSSRMHRRFDVDLYRSESAGWNVEKFINVAAATGRNSVDETIALDHDAPAAGGPDAIIGGLPPADTVAESLGFIDRQMTASRFRGVRPMGRLDQPLPAVEVLRGLQERNLVFELMTHPDQLGVSAEGLSGFDDLTVVVEHTGWPRSNSDEEFTLWRSGIDALAAVGPRVVCKLSGLAMPFGSMRSTLSDRGSSTPSGPSASIVVSSQATSRLTPCMGRSMSCTRRSATSRPASTRRPAPSCSQRTLNASIASDRPRLCR